VPRGDNRTEIGNKRENVTLFDTFKIKKVVNKCLQPSFVPETGQLSNQILLDLIAICELMEITG
jgi:hypothetical protein